MKFPGVVSAVATAVLLTGMALLAHDVHAADEWPNGPITIVIPYAAGGSVDRSTRILAPFLEKELKTAIVIENRPGASGQIGVQSVLRRPADANTVLAEAQPNHSTPIIFQKAPYAFGDIEIINAHEIGNVSLTVLADSPYKTFDDFHKAVKANPGKLSIAFPRGGSNQLMALLLQEKLGWNVLLVPYESGTPARQALLGGHVTAMTNGAVTDADLKPRVRSLALVDPDQARGLARHALCQRRSESVWRRNYAGRRRPVLWVQERNESPISRAFRQVRQGLPGCNEGSGIHCDARESGRCRRDRLPGIDQSERIIADLHKLMLEHQDKFQQQ